MPGPNIDVPVPPTDAIPPPPAGSLPGGHEIDAAGAWAASPDPGRRSRASRSVRPRMLFVAFAVVAVVAAAVWGATGLLGTHEEPPAGHPSSAGTSGPSSGGGASAPNSPEHTVRSYFAAIERSDHAAAARYSTGEVRTMWRWLVREFGRCNCPADVITLGALRTVSRNAGTAVFSFVGRSERGTVYSGPLTVVHTRGRWLVADYLRNGIDLRSSIVTGLTGSQTIDGLRITVFGLYMPDRTGDLWVRVTRTGDPMRAIGLVVTGPAGVTSEPKGLSPNMMQVAEGTVITDFGWAPSRPIAAGDRFDVRPTFQDETTGRTIEFHLRVRVPRTPSA
jgi:hypothetical protein